MTPHQKLKAILEKRQSEKTRALIFMPSRDWQYWLEFPAYAHMYIRPHYDLITDLEGLIEFVHHFLGEYQETDDDRAKEAVEGIVFPIYESLTGKHFDTNYFKALGV